MHIIGIITEYNPFHNGHLYHIKKIKEMYADSLIICVTSTSFTQRGDVSIINKWDKARISLEMGVDIVIELPYVFSSQSADIFAKGALKILNELGVNKIVFGSELNDINKLYEIASLTINNNRYEELVKSNMEKGYNYPTASSIATTYITDYSINTPNDILGLCYIKEILKNNYNIEAISIKRTNDYNSLNLTGNISSASSIRTCLKDNISICDYVPKNVINSIYNINKMEQNLFEFLKYKILTEKNLSIYQTVDEGIDNKIKKCIYACNNKDELINALKSKRYTNSKIKRMITHILVGFTKEEAKNNNDIKYIRVLGFSNAGRKYLSIVKKTSSIPIITNFYKDDMLLIEKRVTDVYSMITCDLKLSYQEYKNKPINK